jgi:hypothetical protein
LSIDISLQKSLKEKLKKADLHYTYKCGLIQTSWDDLLKEASMVKCFLMLSPLKYRPARR